MHAEALISHECLLAVGSEPFIKQIRQLARFLAANLAHNEKHGVLHGRETDTVPVPETAVKQNVQIDRDEAQLADDDLFRIARNEGREEHLILRGETKSGIVEYVLQTRGEGSR